MNFERTWTLPLWNVKHTDCARKSLVQFISRSHETGWRGGVHKSDEHWERLFH